MYNINMIVRSIRKDNEGFEEWQFGHSFADYRSAQNQIMQDIYTALYEWKYDCFFALENGIDWYVRLGSKNQKELLDEDVYNTILNRQGVLSAFDFNSNVSGRHYTCSCKVFTEYSDNELNIEFSI